MQPPLGKRVLLLLRGLCLRLGLTPPPAPNPGMASDRTRQDPLRAHPADRSAHRVSAPHPHILGTADGSTILQSRQIYESDDGAVHPAVGADVQLLR